MAQGFTNILGRHGLDDAVFCNDSGNQPGGSYVKRWRKTGNIRRGDLPILNESNFFRTTKLNGNCGPVRNGEIEGRAWGGYIKGNAVGVSENGDPVGADLVGGIAVGRDSVGAG